MGRVCLNGHQMGLDKSDHHTNIMVRIDKSDHKTNVMVIIDKPAHHKHAGLNMFIALCAEIHKGPFVYA